MVDQTQDTLLKATLSAEANELSPHEVGAVLVQQFEVRSREVKRRSTRMTLLLRIGLLVAVLLLWEVLTSPIAIGQLQFGPILDPFFFSRPSAIAVALWKWILDGQLLYHLSFTLEATVAGYLVGVTLGLTLAVAFGLMYFAFRVVEPLILIIYSVPSVAIGPLLIIWFGIGMTPKIILAAFFVFFVVFMNTITGIRNINTSLVDIALVMGASRRSIIFKIILPSAFPYIITALRITLPTALIGAVVGEFISSNRGIAYLIMASSLRFRTAQTFAALLVLGLVVVVLNSALTPLETRLMRWKPKKMEIVQ